MFPIFAILCLFFRLTIVITAAPLEERQSGLQIIRNCQNSGQVALTFDGMSFNEYPQCVEHE